MLPMARTAPVPNIPAIPGMNPGVFILGGGGGGGGSNGTGGNGGAGRQGAGGSNGGKSASGGGKGALDPQRYPLCGTKSHPVDVATGRAFTHPSVIGDARRTRAGSRLIRSTGGPGAARRQLP
ncbi:hypothetical protein [Sorangium atrum]|uniref:Uncharacterized protein n=1 Tax=Sorangium atrum TaxID=2995308 RepID=A0ABT5C2R6_9BACT|nr:hypothetical protein [Sorangium aterium]MDC0680155.1 hypothetical protein [Sorangium aterium]